MTARADTVDVAELYRREPYRCVCRTCDESEVRDNRQDALDFAEEHARGNVVLSPAMNLAGWFP